MRTVQLSQLSVNAEAEVQDLAGPPQFRNRLFSLGITPRSRLVLVRRMPLGGPLEIEVRGTRLAIRRHDADRVWVCVVG
ncbi:FeoA family protein [Alicyclobacillus shizuokensis]|uniref:FeoA family protein n=1 Tax=Alicyclobacillus shizuokensis TaxID=392014 RepID=UPI000AD757BF|nr:ferrous iron transport protein A [Alicyclobacillus shizuokensis]MCL6625195.1 ferrous iron transport protein A [Alicyclobacillus shizuokensis]